jgi:glycosyltransferase involved in cell wall biosynthesis
MEPLGVRRLGYVEHGRALEELAASHAVLCILDDAPGAERIYPGKIFELLYLGLPCLTIAPEGVLADFAREHDLGVVVSPTDPDAIVGALSAWLQAFRDRKWATCDRRDSNGRQAGMERFHRRRLAGEFAQVFERAIIRSRREMPQPVPSTSAAK